VGRPVVWSDPAVDDLEAATFVAKDSEAYAAAWPSSRLVQPSLCRPFPIAGIGCLTRSCRGIAS
jgi:hypothetical protein